MIGIYRTEKIYAQTKRDKRVDLKFCSHAKDTYFFVLKWVAFFIIYFFILVLDGSSYW